jgi:hypothetical protein
MEMENHKPRNTGKYLFTTLVTTDERVRSGTELAYGAIYIFRMAEMNAFRVFIISDQQQLFSIYGKR